MSLRRQVRAVLDQGAKWSGVLRSYERRMSNGVTVLMFHRVLSQEQCRDYPFTSLVMPDRLFAEQLAWLSKNVEVLPLGLARAAMERPRTDPRPLVALTFDDGYWDNAEIAAPMLEGQGLRGTFFVTSDFVRTGDLMWFDRAVLTVKASSDQDLRVSAQAHSIVPPVEFELAQGRVPAWVEALKRSPFQHRMDFLRSLSSPSIDPGGSAIFRAMTPEQVAGLSRRGHEIGSHSVSHEILTLASEESLATELVASRETIAGWIDGPVNGFCYPNGSHDERVAKATRRAGYEYACTTLPPVRNHPQDPWRLGRLDITPDRVSHNGATLDLTAFRAEICGLREVWR